MAEGKNKVIVYKDWKDTFKALTDDEAGKLIKHFFAYINDEDPESDRLTTLLFEPIKATLKRDLKKWESIQERNRNNGSLGGRPSKKEEPKKTQENPMGFSETQKNPKKPDSDIDSVIIDSDIDNVPLEKETKFIFKTALLELGFEKQLVEDWLLVRKTKKLTNSKTSLLAFIKEIEKSNLLPNEVLRICVERSWGCFKNEWLNNQNSHQNLNNGNTKPTREDIQRKYISDVLSRNQQ